MANEKVYVPQYHGGSYDDAFQYTSDNAYRNKADAEAEILSGGFEKKRDWGIEYDRNMDDHDEDFGYIAHSAEILELGVK